MLRRGRTLYEACQTLSETHVADMTNGDDLKGFRYHQRQTTTTKGLLTEGPMAEYTTIH